MPPTANETTHKPRRVYSPPKHRVISQQLADQIVGGRMPPNEKLPSEVELGQQFGVSRLTIRGALDTLEREGLIYRQQGRGTFVATYEGSGAGLVNDLHQLVLLFVDIEAEDSDFTLSEMADAERYLSQRGIAFSWASIRTEDILRGKYPPVLQKRLCQGVLMDGFLHDCHFALRDLLGVPVVAIGNHPLDTSLPQVRHDIESKVRAACRTLHALNPAPIALLIEPFSIYSSQEMVQAYTAAIRELGQRRDLLYLCPNDQQGDAVEHLLGETGGAFSLLAGDRIIPSVAEAYRKQKLSYREHPVVGFGSRNLLSEDERNAMYFLPLEPREITTRGIELLIDLVENKEPAPYICVDEPIIKPGEVRR